MIKNKKREQITSLTFRRHRQTPNNLKRVMLTPAGANHLLYSWNICKFCRFSETRIKADASQYVCYISKVMLPYAVLF